LAVLKWIRRWLYRLLNIRHPSQTRNAKWPTKEQMLLLPVFEGLELKDITVVSTPAGARRAVEELLAEPVTGFDTESKPTFNRGEVSTGPHVVQFSTLRRAYIFQLHDAECRRAAAGLIADGRLKKVGFGLDGDLTQIRRRLGVDPKGVVDLAVLFAQKGFGRGVGAKVGVALTMNKRLLKSKRTTTTNWAQRRLTDKQALYAANDAYAALRCYEVLTATPAGRR
jgi:ribonuclease D